MSQIVRRIAESADNNAVLSKKEFIAMIKKVNIQNITSGNISVGSMDEVALYPSIIKDWVKKILMQMNYGV
jgi:hypothetical protein